MIQMSPDISNNGFVAVEISANLLSLNLSRLNTFTNYSIHMSVRGEGVSDAPIEIEIIDRTNTSGKLPNGTNSHLLRAFRQAHCTHMRYTIDLHLNNIQAYTGTCQL